MAVVVWLIVIGFGLGTIAALAEGYFADRRRHRCTFCGGRDGRHARGCRVEIDPYE